MNCVNVHCRYSVLDPTVMDHLQFVDDVDVHTNRPNGLTFAEDQIGLS
jgi:hypothetical protein